MTNNTDCGNGGAIFNKGTLTVTASTLAFNTADTQGGGIWSDDTLTLTNSTISGNLVGTDGGGIYNSTGTATINNSTITNNRADAGGTDAGTGGGIHNDGTGTLTLNSTIVATNFVGTDDVRDNISGTASGSSNLVGVDTRLTGLTNGVDGNIVGTAANPIDPGLQPLADNGGPTQTHAILPNSPAPQCGFQ